jgi:AraC-like DNA-binding protein
VLNQLGQLASTSETAADQLSIAQPEAEMVSGVLLRALADVSLQYGVSPEALFQEEATAFMACEPVDVRVPLAQYRRSLERAIALTGEPAIGLRAGLCASESAFDLLAPLVAHVPSLRDAIREIRKFQSLFFGGAYLHFSERSGVARLRWEFPRAHGPSDRSIAEFLTAGIVRMLRAFGCGRSDLYAARFEHRKPPYYRVYASVFQGAERFSEELTGLDFAAHLLDRPHLHSNPTLQTLIRAEVEQRFARVSRPASLVDRLRAYLRNQPAARIPDMSAAARDLGVSVRSLRRRLSEDGLSYRVLSQELQRDQACAMLRDSEFTLQGVAYALGFADSASFHRAFKRWTGLTACEYRGSH